MKIVFQPISINGNVKIYFDAFSTDILDIIRSAYNTKEEAIETTNSEYQSIKENKIIADRLVENGEAKRFMDGSIDSLSIFVSCNSNDTIGDVSSRLKNVASKFLSQDILYGRLTPEETYQRFEETINRYSFLSKGCFENGFSVEGIIKFTRRRVIMGMARILPKAFRFFKDN